MMPAYNQRKRRQDESRRQQQTDEHRPGAELDALDKLTMRERTAPDKTGEAWGMTWAVWRQWPSDSNRYGKIKVYIAGPDGELMHGLDFGYPDRQRKVDHHTVETWDELHKRLWRMYWTRLYDDSDPLADVQDYIRRQTDEKAKRLHHEQWLDIERSKWTVRTERVGNKTRNWIEQS